MEGAIKAALLNKGQMSIIRGIGCNINAYRSSAHARGHNDQDLDGRIYMKYYHYNTVHHGWSRYKCEHLNVSINTSVWMIVR